MELNPDKFSIEDKEFVFLVGPSGAGTTTILKLLLHESFPSQGTIHIDQLHIKGKKLPHVEKLRRKIGMVFQDFKMLTDRNVFENISLSLKVV